MRLPLIELSACEPGLRLCDAARGTAVAVSCGLSVECATGYSDDSK